MIRRTIATLLGQMSRSAEIRQASNLMWQEIQLPLEFKDPDALSEDSFQSICLLDNARAFRLTVGSILISV